MNGCALFLSCLVLQENPIDNFIHRFLNVGSIRKGDTDGLTAILPGRCDFSDAKSQREIFAMANPDSTRTKSYILRDKKI